MFDMMDQWKWENVGNRTSFVMISQLPLSFLLARRRNIFEYLTGMGYERLNWFHRWAVLAQRYHPYRLLVPRLRSI